jgi:hypothetical protein
LSLAASWSASDASNGSTRRLNRQRRIQVAVEEARLRLRESIRLDALLAQADAWHRATRTRQYLAAMKARINELRAAEEISGAAKSGST